MATKAKTFDCVEMKNRIQAERWAEYQAHKDEYESYIDFVLARAERSEWVRKVERKLAVDKGKHG